MIVDFCYCRSLIFDYKSGSLINLLFEHNKLLRASDTILLIPDVFQISGIVPIYSGHSVNIIIGLRSVLYKFCHHLKKHKSPIKCNDN